MKAIAHRMIINKKTGTIQWLTPPPFGFPVDEMARYRFSKIEPVRFLPWLAFKFFRLFGEEGGVAAWTRTWQVLWKCTIMVGPCKGRTSTGYFRSCLVEWERDRWFYN